MNSRRIFCPSSQMIFLAFKEELEGIYHLRSESYVCDDLNAVCEGV